MTESFPPGGGGFPQPEEYGGLTQPGGMPQPGGIPHAGAVPQFGGPPQPAARQETGGPNRTPRSEIGPAVSANRTKEPVLLLDLSTSMDWGAADENSGDYPDPGSRRAIVIGALHGLVRALEAEDSEAAAEQAGGSDERGGLMAHGFANEHVEIGDLNTSNLERRLNSIQWGGRTFIMPAWRAALADYDEEFGDRDPDEQPVMEVLVLTWRRPPPSGCSWSRSSAAAPSTTPPCRPTRRARGRTRPRISSARATSTWSRSTR